MNKEELYKQYCGLIYKVMKDLHCTWKNDDEFQAIYDSGELGLIKAINKVNIQKINSVFFYTYIKNSILNYFHEKTMPKRYLDGTNMLSIEEIDIPSNIDIEKQIIMKDQKQKLIKAFKELKPKYQDVLYRYYVLNETLEQIVKKIGTTKQNVYVIKQVALKKLKEKMKEG